jgi:hypothetical protein
MTARKPNPTAAEALDERVPFTFGGVDYLLPATSAWPFEALEAFEDGKVATFLRHVLGDEQMATFRATKPTVADFQELVVALQKGLGISGN